MAKTVTCLHHLSQPFLGNAERPLRDAGLAVDERFLARGDTLPALAEIDGIITFGGAQSVLDVERDATLRDEVAFLRGAVAAGVPVLGLCLGGQLLAHAMGAQVRRATCRTVAWRDLDPLPAAAGDPVLGRVAGPVPALHWNEDVFTLPPGATELLTGGGEGVEAFRAGPSAWGLQFHPEVDATALDRWYATYPDWVGEAGVSEAQAREADRHHLPAQRVLADDLFGGFARVVAGRPEPPAQPVGVIR